MTNEQINIAIFEIFGWKWEPEKNSFFHPENGRLKPKYAPNYCNDLNAMHEAEKALHEKKKNTFAFMLAQVLDTSPTVDLSDQFLNIHATASQRAEAFLKTLGKWEGAK